MVVLLCNIDSNFIESQGKLCNAGHGLTHNLIIRWHYISERFQQIIDCRVSTYFIDRGKSIVLKSWGHSFCRNLVSFYISFDYSNGEILQFLKTSSSHPQSKEYFLLEFRHTIFLCIISQLLLQLSFIPFIRLDQHLREVNLCINPRIFDLD